MSLPSRGAILLIHGFCACYFELRQQRFLFRVLPLFIGCLGYRLGKITLAPPSLRRSVGLIHWRGTWSRFQNTWVYWMWD